jgi:hypothetical protein
MSQEGRSTRLHRRVPVEFPVVLICSHMGKARIEQGRAIDLGTGGMGIHTDARLREEQPISIEFTLPIEGVPLKVEAEIRHHMDGRYGLRFRYLSFEQANLLKRLIN